MYGLTEKSGSPLFLPDKTVKFAIFGRNLTDFEGFSKTALLFSLFLIKGLCFRPAGLTKFGKWARRSGDGFAFGFAHDPQLCAVYFLSLERAAPSELLWL
jgi:hypothetical protein